MTGSIPSEDVGAGSRGFRPTLPRRTAMTWRPSFNQVVLGVPVIFMTVMYAYPVGVVLSKSFTDPELGLGNFTEVLTDPVTLHVIWITVRIAAMVALVTLVLGFPIAYLMSAQPPRRARALALLVIIPFWTSVLVRSFAWIVLLGDGGVVAKMLKPFGGTGEGLLYSEAAVVVAMSHVLLPFTILIIKGSIDQIDRSLVRAARSLGAGPVRAFLSVYMPLAVPAIVSSGMLVFILGLGYYITPALVGGPQQTTVAMLIQEKTQVTFQLAQATTLSVLLLAISVLMYVLVKRLTKVGGVVLG